MVDVGKTIWHGCHTLRHDGIDETDYLDQMTMLLFLKMSNELKLTIETTSAWSCLRNAPDSRILNLYSETLLTLASSKGPIGEAFKDARSCFARPESLRQVMDILDNVVWTSLDRDVQGEAFEYLLEKAASGGKKGAGQYFTPRPLVKVLVECIKPGFLKGDRLIGDPAAGTGGFLLGAHSWLKQNSIVTHTANSPQYEGVELVPRVRRLGLMNLILHGLPSPMIEGKDALAASDIEPKFDVIITNPPFGSKGGSVINNSHYWYPTSNKQIGFLQMIVASLKPGGRAAIVLPDNCFFGAQSSLLGPILLSSVVFTPSCGYREVRSRRILPASSLM